MKPKKPLAFVQRFGGGDNVSEMGNFTGTQLSMPVKPHEWDASCQARIRLRGKSYDFVLLFSRREQNYSRRGLLDLLEPPRTSKSQMHFSNGLVVSQFE